MEHPTGSGCRRSAPLDRTGTPPASRRARDESYRRLTDPADRANETTAAHVRDRTDPVTHERPRTLPAITASATGRPTCTGLSRGGIEHSAGPAAAVDEERAEGDASVRPHRSASDLVPTRASTRRAAPSSLANPICRPSASNASSVIGPSVMKTSRRAMSGGSAGAHPPPSAQARAEPTRSQEQAQLRILFEQPDRRRVEPTCLRLAGLLVGVPTLNEGKAGDDRDDCDRRCSEREQAMKTRATSLLVRRGAARPRAQSDGAHARRAPAGPGRRGRSRSGRSRPPRRSAGCAARPASRAPGAAPRGSPCRSRRDPRSRGRSSFRTA